MDKISLLKSKLNDFINRSEDMDQKELRQVIVYMLEISNKNIDRLIELNETSVKQNKELHQYTEDLKLIIGAFSDFLVLKSLDKEFQFYLRGIGVS